MNRNVSWIAILILLITVIALVYFNFINKENNKVEVKTETADVVYDYDRSIENLKREMKLLEQEITSLKKSVSDLAKSIQSTRATTRPAPTPTPTPKPEPRPEPEPDPEPRTQIDRKADLSHLRNVSGDIIFCVMANNDGGKHFPQYALERGVTFNAVRSNTTSDGNNWVVEPVSEIRGDYGVTHDGTFFVSHEVISDIMSDELVNLQIKSGFTGWDGKDMSKEYIEAHDKYYWVYKTR